MKIDLNGNIYELDKLLKEYHDLKNDTYIAALAKVESYANTKIKEYTTYWCKNIDKVYTKDSNKAQFIIEWEDKIQKTKVNGAAFRGHPGVFWSKVKYGGLPIYTIIRKIEQQNTISELLMSFSLDAVVGAHTLLGIERHVKFLKRRKKDTKKTFNWIGDKDLDYIYTSINGKVLSMSKETFFLFFSNKPIHLITEKIINLKTIGYLGFFFKSLIDEELIEGCQYQSILKSTIKSLGNTLSKETGKIVNNEDHIHRETILEFVQKLK